MSLANSQWKMRLCRTVVKVCKVTVALFIMELKFKYDCKFVKDLVLICLPICKRIGFFFSACYNRLCDYL